MRIIGAFLVVVFVLCIPLFLLTSNLRCAASSRGLYQYGFSTYNVARSTGISYEELGVVAREMIHYFNSGQEPLEPSVTNPEGGPLFSQKEIDHLREVKELIGLCGRVQMGTLVYIVAFILGGFIWRRRRFASLLAKSMIAGAATTVVVVVGIGAAGFVGFDWLFLQFHYLMFSSDTWRLNPATDYLIRMFPAGFFRDAGLFVGGACIVEALVVGGIGGVFLTRRRRAES
ncbi:MAG: TIGR01906 family membrane protein [Chloroflexota bacterium]